MTGFANIKYSVKFNKHFGISPSKLLQHRYFSKLLISITQKQTYLSIIKPYFSNGIPNIVSITVDLNEIFAKFFGQQS